MELAQLERPESREAKVARISVRTLALANFRNYTRARLELEPLPVILTGPNGAGKTSLLEAVSFLAPGRGLRRAKLAEVERIGGGPWAVAATVETPAGEVAIGTGRDDAGEDKRLVKIDGKPVRGHTELAQYVSMVWLTPQMDQLFTEGQSARRKFLDRLVYSFDPDHASRVNAYEYAMRERNRLLSMGRADPHWLSSLESKLAEQASAIALARLSTAAHLNEVMHASPLSFPKAELGLSGFAEDALSRGEPALHVEQALAEALEKARGADAQTGRTSIGTHRSELTVTHVGKNMEAALCSTGEQKALLLAMVLAEARAGQLWHGRVPVVLLDEVVAHLDAQKRSELFEEITALGAQVWMTGTDSSLFSGLENARFFRVSAGALAPG